VPIANHRPAKLLQGGSDVGCNPMPWFYRRSAIIGQQTPVRHLPSFQVTGAKGVAVPSCDGRTCPGHPHSRALCRPDRDRRDKPGDDELAATSFAPVTFSVSFQRKRESSTPQHRQGTGSSAGACHGAGPLVGDDTAFDSIRTKSALTPDKPSGRRTCCVLEAKCTLMRRGMQNKTPAGSPGFAAYANGRQRILALTN
jgi:hypothetical protein